MMEPDTDHQLRSLSIRAMNTHIEVLCRTDAETMNLVQETADDWFAQVEERFSRFLPESELQFLNLQAGEHCLVSDVMFEVLQLAEAYRQQTNGAFHPLLLHPLERLGYNVSFERLRERTEYRVPPAQDAVQPSAGIELNTVMKSARLPRGTRLDLGGIVKGWAAGKLAGYLRDRLEIGAGVVNVGGDLASWCPSEDEGEPWFIGIENPWEPHRDTGVLALRSGAAATSSTLGRSWTTDRGIMHHLIDPRTGMSAASRVVQCTVAGPDAAACEAWSKALCVLGLTEGLQLMRTRTRQYEAVIFTEDRHIIGFGDSSSFGDRWLHIPIDKFESR
ncbi:FAD:protein FMN transferase [Paenibacillus chartarius]|uniref:FAD:protein FMN transferase n=1 Tax=Paenibacillus chartarius TaxID=747481 RepID=A0ABV6DR48_9BACL